MDSHMLVVYPAHVILSICSICSHYLVRVQSQACARAISNTHKTRELAAAI